MGAVERVTHDILQSWFGQPPHREERKERGQNEREVRNRASQILHTHTHVRDCFMLQFSLSGEDTASKKTHLEWKSPEYKLKKSARKDRIFAQDG